MSDIDQGGMNMANFFGINGSLYGNNTSGNWMTGISSLYSDYNSIKSGTYHKLLKAYYNPDPNSKSKVNELVSKKETETDKKLSNTKADASSLNESAEALTTKGSKNLFKKQEITTKDETTGEETTTLDYDRDKITKAVKSFVDDYNSLLESGSDVSSPSILKKTLQMTNATKANKNLLADVGISISKNNKLTIDEEKFKKADMNTVMTLFNGPNSYADKIAQQSDQIAKTAAQEATKTAGLYNNNGGYYNNSYSYNSMLNYYS